MTKYKLEGLDCAVCANKIENELRTREGFETATINFPMKTLVLDTKALSPQLEEKARDLIKKIEPAVTLIGLNTKKSEVSDKKSGLMGVLVNPLFGIALSAILLLLGFLSNKDWVFFTSYLIVGYPVLKSAFKDILTGKFFNEMFLMALATIGALALGEIPEAVGVMLFYSIGEYLQNKAVEKSRTEIASLLDLRPEFARAVRGEERIVVEPDAVAVGEIVEVLPGERIPLDGIIVEGSTFLDTSSLTGESVPRSAGAGDSALAGFINESGRVLIKTTAIFGQTAAARILDLVENASAHKAPTEKFISKVAGYYTPFVVFAALALAFIPPLVLPGARFSDWIHRALVLLVISCPCALVISIPLGYFGGVGSASRHKVLIKGADYLDALLHVDTVVFDKTGTLTEGNFTVVRVEPTDNFTKESLLALVSSAESISPHPIARAIRQSAGIHDPAVTVSDICEHKGLGVSATVNGKRVIAGNTKFVQSRGVTPQNIGNDHPGGTEILVAVDENYAGRIIVADTIKSSSVLAIKALRELGTRRIVMLTGDRGKVAASVAESLGISEYRAELLPQDKVEAIEEISKELPSGKKIVFVGDGMNDAPVLMRSDIGIAMGGLGSDAAIEAADIVIMDDSVSRVPLAIKIAQFTRKIVVQNVVFSLAVKGAFLLLGATGGATMWEAVIADVGVALVAVLNSIRAARIEIKS